MPEGNAKSVSGTRHTTQGVPYEWHAVAHGDETYVVRDVPEGTAALYHVVGRTCSVRRLAAAEAAIYEGNVVSTYYDDELHRTEFAHDYAGRLGAEQVEEFLDEPAILLERVRTGTADLMEATA